MSGPRYSIIPNDAIDDTRVKEAHLRVLAVLGSHSDKKGWCEVNQAKVALRARCARETVNRVVKDLRAWGYLRVKPQKSPNGRNINRYQVVMDQDGEGTGDAHVTPRVTQLDHNRCDPQTSQLNDPLLTTIPSAPLPDLNAIFGSIVEIWPRFEERHRGEAWELFLALTGIEQAQLLSAARRYPQEVRDEAARQRRSLDQHRRFTKSLPRWIGERRWLGSEVLPSTDGLVSVKRDDPIYEACALIEGSKAALNNAGSWMFKATTIAAVKAAVRVEA